MKGKSKKIKKLGVNKWLRISLAVLSAIILIISACLAYTIQKYHKYINQKYSVYAYNNKANINYEVVLVPNNLYTEKSLGEGKTYISNLVDSINATFKYEFKGERPSKVQGKYNVTAILEGFIPVDGNNVLVWKKEFILQPDTNFEGDNGIVTLESKLPVNIKSYNTFVEEASKVAQINFLSKLTVLWDITTAAQTDKGIAKENMASAMEIPLGENYFQIAGKLSDEKKGAIEETRQVISPAYSRNIIIYCALGVIGIASLLFLLIFTAPLAELSPINKKRKQIFKEHGSRLAAVWSEISSVSRNILEVTSIDDLVKIADDVGRPILYKNSGNEEEIFEFYVVDEEKLYMLDIRKEFSDNIIDSSVKASPVSM